MQKAVKLPDYAEITTIEGVGIPMEKLRMVQNHTGGTFGASGYGETPLDAPTPPSRTPSTTRQVLGSRASRHAPRTCWRR